MALSGKPNQLPCQAAKTIDQGHEYQDDHQAHLLLTIKQCFTIFREAIRKNTSR
jgi:hypothetical protein